MTVYVDDMRARFGRMVMCHMIADSDEELHAMAARIGIARRWHQAPPKASTSHYDIALSKRALAIAAGAVEITVRQCAAMARNRRLTGVLGESPTLCNGDSLMNKEEHTRAVERELDQMKERVDSIESLVAVEVTLQNGVRVPTLITCRNVTLMEAASEELRAHLWRIAELLTGKTYLGRERALLAGDVGVDMAAPDGDRTVSKVQRSDALELAEEDAILEDAGAGGPADGVRVHCGLVGFVRADFSDSPADFGEISKIEDKRFTRPVYSQPVQFISMDMAAPDGDRTVVAEVPR